MERNNSYKSFGISVLSAVMSWAAGVKSGVRQHTNDEITYNYFVERLGVTEELALKLLENEKALTMGSVRSQLDLLYKLE